jgi:hypothetical protein
MRLLVVFRSPWSGSRHFQNEGGRPRHLQRWIPTLELLEDRTVPSFLAPVNYYIGPSAGRLTVGDFNGDGLADLVPLQVLILG